MDEPVTVGTLVYFAIGILIGGFILTPIINRIIWWWEDRRD